MGEVVGCNPKLYILVYTERLCAVHSYIHRLYDTVECFHISAHPIEISTPGKVCPGFSYPHINSEPHSDGTLPALGAVCAGPLVYMRVGFSLSPADLEAEVKVP